MDEVYSAAKELVSDGKDFLFVYKFLSSRVSERVCRPASSGPWQHSEVGKSLHVVMTQMITASPAPL